MLTEVKPASLCILCPGASDDQTSVGESTAAASHSGGSHLLHPHILPLLPPLPSCLVRSHMKDLPSHWCWELKDKLGSEVIAGPSPGNREFPDSSDTATRTV